VKKQASSFASITAFNAIRALFDVSQSEADLGDEILTLDTVVWRSPYAPVETDAGGRKITSEQTNAAPSLHPKVGDVSAKGLQTHQPPSNTAKPNTIKPGHQNDRNTEIAMLIRMQINQWLDENMASLVEHALRGAHEMRKTSSQSRSRPTPLSRD
jgi:hypothetical protein